jgi:hypothetical protein
MKHDLHCTALCARSLVALAVLALRILWLPSAPARASEAALPACEEQRLLHEHLVAAFGTAYVTHYLQHQDRVFCDGETVYYLRREIQAFLDMWRATGDKPYLDQARNLTLRAIDEATANPRPLLRHDELRGEWPCFHLDKVAAQTGGHNQLCDFQGSVGFLMTARCLEQVNHPAWKEIADFVERDVVEKWLYYSPSVVEWHFTGPKSCENVLAALNCGRDVREHFACICLDLHKLGYRTYPYLKWASLLIDLYLTCRDDPNQPAPHADEVPNRIPQDWGLLPHTTRDGYVWLAVPNYDPNRTAVAMDTSHANRTVWLAARACSEGLLDQSIVDGLVNTLRFQVWDPGKGPFYFNNYLDGTDGDLNGLEGGRGGNVWFGWHRLAAYDELLCDLFLSIASDLAHGGINLPSGAQNKAMQNATLCLEAWGLRLLSGEKGRPFHFP